MNRGVITSRAAMRLRECYDLLEIPPTASDGEVKAAHRDLARVWHPDRFAHDSALRTKAEEKLKTINEAYETIVASRSGKTRGTYREPESGPRPESPAERAARAESVRKHAVAKNRTWAITCAAAGVLFLLRRPTPGGLAIALLLFAAAALFVMRMRKSERSGGGEDGR